MNEEALSDLTLFKFIVKTTLTKNLGYLLKKGNIIFDMDLRYKFYLMKYHGISKKKVVMIKVYLTWVNSDHYVIIPFIS